MKISTLRFQTVFSGRGRSYALLLCFLFGVFKISVLGGWDQSFYWGQLTSFWYDGDLTLHDDLLANHNPLPDQYRTLTMLTPEGTLPNTFAIGTTVIDGLYAGPILLLLRWFHLPRMNGVLLSVVAIMTLLKLFVLLLSLEGLVQQVLPHPGVVLGVSIATFCGTPLIYYTLRDYGMSHLNSGVLAVGFLLAFIAWLNNPGIWQSLTFGIISGLLLLNRWQDGTYLCLVFPPFIYQMARSSAIQRRQYVTGLIAAIGCLAMILSVQSIAWYKQFGTFAHIPQGQAYMQWQSPQWAPLLFSGYHGVIPWSPMTVIALLGLISGSFTRRGVWRWIMVGSLLTTLVSLYVNAAALDWWGGWSYGARRLCALTPIFALGLAEIAQRLRRPAMLLILGLTLSWAYVTFTCYESRIDDLSLLFRGEPSRWAPAHDASYWLSDATAARAAFGQQLLRAPAYRGSRLFSFKRLRLVNQGLSAVTLIAGFLVIEWGRRIWRQSDHLKQWSVTFMLGYLLTVLLVMMFYFPDSFRLNAPWQKYVTGQISAEQAIAHGLPRVSVVLIRAVDLARANRFEAVEKMMAPIDLRAYPNLHHDAIERFVRDTDQLSP